MSSASAVVGGACVCVGAVGNAASSSGATAKGLLSGAGAAKEGLFGGEALLDLTLACLAPPGRRLRMTTSPSSTPSLAHVLASWSGRPMALRHSMSSATMSEVADTALAARPHTAAICSSLHTSIACRVPLSTSYW